jgi:O-antigen/teichoic acid export membrane protein
VTDLPRNSRTPSGERGFATAAPATAFGAPSILRRLSARARGLAGNRLTQQLAWVVAPFALMQLARLGGNIVLTRLLAPEIFGLMLLVNALRTGTELLSDIGIGQSVVRSPHGEERRFLDVAWTLQLLRGALLTLSMLLAAAPIASIYGKPELQPVVLAISPIFILTGLQSPALFLIQRRLELRRRAVFDLVNTGLGIAATIALALVMPTIWALVIGLLLSVALSTALTYVVGDRRLPRPAWDGRFVREIIAFGKWIFLSTALFFAATSYDKLYFVAAVPIALAGIYGVARTFSDMFTQLAQRTGALLVFPKVAAMGERRDPVTAARLRATRRKTLALVAVGTGAAIAGSDQFILLAYDSRYHAAAFMIPVLFVGVWFGTLSAFADAMMMGAGKPAAGAWANGVKFLVMAAGLPLALARGDFFAALLVLVAAEGARWAVLVPPSRREGLTKVTDDVLLTVLMVASALGLKSALGAVDLVPSISEWWAMRSLLGE